MTHTHTHAYTHTCTHTRTRMYMHARTRACTHARMHARTHTHTHAHTRACVHVSALHIDILYANISSLGAVLKWVCKLYLELFSCGYANCTWSCSHVGMQTLCITRSCSHAALPSQTKLLINCEYQNRYTHTYMHTRYSYMYMYMINSLVWIVVCILMLCM